jgi:hypothetical protein
MGIFGRTAESDAGRDLPRADRPDSGNGLANPLGNLPGARRIRSREQKSELVAPIAEAEIAVADGPGDRPPGSLEE